VAENGSLQFDPLGGVQLVAIADETSSSLRHELRNKLASVRSAEFYIRRRLKSSEAWQADPRLEELSGIIQDEMRVANELLDQRQRLQNLFTPAPARIDAAECVRSAVAWTRKAADCHVAIELDAQAGYVSADPSELSLAVRCLLENAVEALGTTGLVRVRALSEMARYVILIEDAGAGIPEAQRAAVLEPFHTTKPGRAGLGLNIARRVAERYAGSLRFRDAAVGTAIALELTLYESNPNSAELGT
jgi:signal transduction histidine kinase